MEAPSTPAVIYAKCRPRGVDAWSIAEKHRVVFAGYPLWTVAAPPPNLTRGFGQYIQDLAAAACAMYCLWVRARSEGAEGAWHRAATRPRAIARRPAPAGMTVEDGAMVSWRV